MSKPSSRLPIAAALASALLLAVPSFADSQARIVRLSDVQGDVHIDRNSGQGFEKAFLNLPITQGVKLKTGKDARAEVEFEDGSTLRITPETNIEFPVLSLRDSGAKVSTVNLEKGMAYVNFQGAKNDEFAVTFGQQKLTLPRPVHLRIETEASKAAVAVFKGQVQISTPGGPVDVSKNETATFDLAHGDRETLAKNVEPSPYDSWDKQQEQYYDRYASNGSVGSTSPYAYGATDLNYYGSFFNLAGYGMFWQPYFIGAGWDPFLNGAWAFYPGYGYGWVSAYPWGWTPYHYGSWRFLPDRGWAWQPGGSWSPYNTRLSVQNPPTKFVLPQPPNSGQGTVFVNRGTMANQVGLFRRLEIRQNSAGLGIPRGEIQNLSMLSPIVQQRGAAKVWMPPASLGDSGWWHGGYSEPNAGVGAWHGSGMSGSTGHSSGGHSSGGGSHH